MNSELRLTLDEILSGATRPTADVITHLGLLVERTVTQRIDDPQYELLGVPESWLDDKLGVEDISSILEVLVRVLNEDSELSPTAAWGLGKSFLDSVVPSLCQALEKVADRDDRLVHQLLHALDNHGKEVAAATIDLISERGRGKAKQLANEISSRRNG